MILNLITKRKFEVIVIVILLASLGFVLPYSISGVINSAVGESIVPVVKSLEKLDGQISFLEQIRKNEITERAVAAYGKIFTIEDLKNNPNNRINIKQALLIEHSKEILMTIDRDRTDEFYNYLIKINAVATADPPETIDLVDDKALVMVK